jgi:hypothetical protein
VIQRQDGIDVSWLFNWDEAAKRPWTTVVSMSLSGLVGGGLIGYFASVTAQGMALRSDSPSP